MSRGSPRGMKVSLAVHEAEDHSILYIRSHFLSTALVLRPLFAPRRSLASIARQPVSTAAPGTDAESVQSPPFDRS
jgi:hypothetical protein